MDKRNFPFLYKEVLGQGQPEWGSPALLQCWQSRLQPFSCVILTETQCETTQSCADGLIIARGRKRLLSLWLLKNEYFPSISLSDFCLNGSALCHRLWSIVVTGRGCLAITIGSVVSGPLLWVRYRPAIPVDTTLWRLIPEYTLLGRVRGCLWGWVGKVRELERTNTVCPRQLLKL